MTKLSWIIRAQIFVKDDDGHYAEIDENQITGLQWEDKNDSK